MKVICVDDERLLMEDTTSLCRTLKQVDEAVGFTRPSEALQWLERERADVALLDINMPGMDGLELAKIIRERWPDTAIIFLTGYSQYALDAFEIHASGYLMKPVKRDRLEAELIHAAPKASAPAETKAAAQKLKVQCFGYFEVFWRDQPLMFARRQTRELLAYLIDRAGAACTAEEVVAALWPEESDLKGAKSRLRQLISDLKGTLSEIGMEGLLIRRSGQVAVRRDMLDCDYYRMLAGDAEAAKAFHGEYMSQYSWAELTEARLHFRPT